MQHRQDDKRAIKINFLPPKLDQSNIQDKIVCVRPMREGKPRISAEVHDSQLRIHNYGHGGSGWTLLWGSVDCAVDLFLEKLHTTPLYQGKPVVIVGAGAMGLGCALKLAQVKEKQPQFGIGDIRVVADKTDNIASYNAAGLWAQVSMRNDPQGQGFVNALSQKSFKRYLKIARGKDSDFLSGAAELQPYFIKPGTESGVDCLVETGIIPPPLEIQADFGEQKHDVLMYQTIYINTHVFMRCFHQQLGKHHISIEQRKVTDLAEFGNNTIVFDCAGLGAGSLNHDSSVVPVYGHLITLKNQPKEFLDTTRANNNLMLVDGAVIEEGLNKLGEYARYLFNKPERRKRFLDQLNKMYGDNQTWFDSSEARVIFIRDLSRLIYLVKTYEADKTDDIVEIYANLVPRINSRYMFLIKDRFTKAESPASGQPPQTYEGCAYFMVTSNRLPEEILQETPDAAGYAVGKIGGTFLPPDQMLLTSHEKEFSAMLNRVGEYCHGPGFFAAQGKDSRQQASAAVEKKLAP